MIDIKLIRENPELVKEGIKNKNDKSDIDELLRLDKLRREKLQQVEELKAKRNSASQQIGKLKKAGESTDEIMSEMKQLSDEIKKLDEEVREVNEKSIFQNVPTYAVDKNALTVDEVTIVVQVNGKVRAKFSLPVDSEEEKVKEVVWANDNVKTHTEGKIVIKEIYIKNKIYNIVVK